MSCSAELPFLRRLGDVQIVICLCVAVAARLSTLMDSLENDSDRAARQLERGDVPIKDLSTYLALRTRVHLLRQKHESLMGTGGLTR